MRWWNVAFLAVGLIGLGFFAASVGPERLFGELDRLGWTVALVAAVNGVTLLVDSAVLSVCLGAPLRLASYARILRAQVAGHAINTVTPTGNLGEVTKYTILTQTWSKQEVGAALLSANLVGLGANVVLLVLAPLAAPLMLGLTGPVARVFYVAAAVSAALGGVLAVVVVRGPGTWPFHVVRRLGVSEAKVERARTAWREVADTARARLTGRRRAAAVVLALVSRGLSVAEIAVILALVGVDAHPLVPFLFVANGQIISWVTSFVPMQAGTGEGGGYALFRSLGLDPTQGVVVELVRKCRIVVWLIIGLALLGTATLSGRKRRSAPDRAS